MKILLLLLFPLTALAQPPRASGVVVVFNVPSGNCAYNAPVQRLGPSNALYGCLLPTYASLTGTWGAISTGGGSGVTSVGFSTNLGTVTGSPVTSAGTLTNTVSAAQVVGLFSTCSGVQYLGADGACHNSSGGGATIPNTTNIIKGDGAGNGADSGYAAQNASTSLTGFLTSTDWNTFNNKAAAGASTTVNGQTCALGSTCTVQVPISSGVTGLGTGIATALGIATGSAGAPVLLNGALGTPSSGTATNLTGLPIAGITGLGTGVATALAANVSGSGDICLASGSACASGGGGGANITSGTYASLPGTCTHTSTQSDIYIMTDAPYQAVCTSTNTWSYFIYGAGGFGQVYPPALLGSWVWDNQGSSTIDATHGFFSMKIVGTNGTTAAIYYRAKTAPYTITALIDISGGHGATGYGLTFRDAAGKLEPLYYQFAGGQIYIQNWTDSTHYSFDVITQPNYGPNSSRPFWYRIEDNNTNFITSISQDGQNWVQIDSVSRTAFTSGSTGAGIFFYNAGGLLANVLSWQEQ